MWTSLLFLSITYQSCFYLELSYSFFCFYCIFGIFTYITYIYIHTDRKTQTLQNKARQHKMLLLYLQNDFIDIIVKKLFEQHCYGLLIDMYLQLDLTSVLWLFHFTEKYFSAREFFFGYNTYEYSFQQSFDKKLFFSTSRFAYIHLNNNTQHINCLIIRSK